ncbi:MAG: ATP-binding protein [Patescibacteria group bacterium]|nr:ATP-binding protein [Patescibacteria group bacterium]
MSAPTLYLFVGYPGAGKTTAARVLEQATGAVHLWADNLRWEMFKQPSHSALESRELYEHLNDQTAQLLRTGKSVIFDTNFNFRADRDYLRHIAEENGAQTVLIWLTTPVEVAHERASHSDTTRNGYTVNMTHDMFYNIVSKLEPPTEDENPIKYDGTKLDVAALSAQFGTHGQPPQTTTQT